MIRRRAPLSALLEGSTQDVIARLSALMLAAILALSVGAYAVLHYGVLDRGPEYRAEFTDAWPLVAGMDVRVSGAVVGSVRKVELTDEGTAEVTFQLRPGVPHPRADATVAIRQDDLLGDSDLSLSLGASSRPLITPIPVARSIQEPRLDDFLDIFQRPVRAALQAFIVELGTAMENRGLDVNAAVLQLRPGFEALGNVFTELNGQLTALRQVLSKAHTVTHQLASRSSDLDRFVVQLQRTVTEVAGQSASLDAGLARLPATLDQTGTTLQKVGALTGAVRPLAQTIAAAAPGFERAAGLVGPYAQALGEASRLASPTIELAGHALRAAAPSLQALHKIRVADLLNPTGGLFAALSPILGRLADGLFGTAAGGGGLGGVILPGNDATAPNVDPARDYLSGYLVVSCELFGVSNSPGCLAKILSTYASAAQNQTNRAARAAGAQRVNASPGPSATVHRKAAGAPAHSAPATGTPATTTPAPAPPAPPPGTPANPLAPLIHFLLGR